MQNQRNYYDNSFQNNLNQVQDKNQTIKSEQTIIKHPYSSQQLSNKQYNLQDQTFQSTNQWQNSNSILGNYYLPIVYQQQHNQISGDFHQIISSMYLALGNQSKLLCQLVSKNQQNIMKTTKIYNEMVTLKKQQIDENENHTKPQIQKNKGDDITATDLLNILYDSKTNFKYSLVIDKDYPLDKILYRERNFQLKINLVDENGIIYPNSNKIPISLALYTVQNPPKFLQSNTLGNKMLKGSTEQDLVNGACLFQKIQIKEVTSHYRKGMLFLVAFTKMPSFGSIVDTKFVEYSSIRPLIMDRIVVKAKKNKEQTTKDIVSIIKIKQKDSEVDEGNR